MNNCPEPAEYGMIDFHTHNFPDALAPRAIASMVDKLKEHLGLNNWSGTLKRVIISLVNLVVL